MTSPNIEALRHRMRIDLTEMEAEQDARRYFQAIYLRTTRTVNDEIVRGGFADAEWMRSWELVFADYYLRALDADRGREPIPAPWRAAFDAARDQPDMAPVRHALFAVNAHFNFDFPQALLDVMSVADFDDPTVLGARHADQHHLDDVFRGRVRTENAALDAAAHQSLMERLLRPMNRVATRRILTESRSRAWRNAVVLDQARRHGSAAYSATLADLETLCMIKVLDLTAPGPVLLSLARRGFGVLLPGA